MSAPAEDARATALERLAGRRFDLLVVGGGIVGAGVAELAARHGLAVALVERDDFGSGTSSASSKLVHGGLRYLRTGQFGLVREALREVRTLSRIVAPHLVRPLKFVLPIYRGGPYGRAPIQGALWSYAGLTGAISERGRTIAPVAAASLVPALRTEGLRAAGLYADAQTDDARLCLTVVRGAAAAGAVVLNRAELVGLERGPVAHVRDIADGVSAAVAARTVVNAAGPWVDDVRRLEDPAAGTSATLSKGAHLVLEPLGDWHAALTIPVDRTRVAFAVPWAGTLLLGTTDTPFEGDARELQPSEDDERQILAEAGLAIDGDVLAGATIQARFAGVRVLPAGARETARAPRETVFSRGRLGVLSVAGGKLTTYRRIALAALHALRPELALHRIDRAPRPLPGAADPEVVADALVRRLPDLDTATAVHLARAYGSLAFEVLACGPLEPLAAGGPELEAEVVYARDREWALTVDDVLRRRTTVTLSGRASAAVRARVEELLRS
jgi:glycerol-3-phosphate dehydrogenase